MAKMLGKTSHTCTYRCCGVWFKEKTKQRRYLKRSERNQWKESNEVRKSADDARTAQ